MSFFKKLFGRKKVVYVEPLQIEKYETFKDDFENIIHASDLGTDVPNMYLYAVIRLSDFDIRLDEIHYTDEDLIQMFGKDSSGNQIINKESTIADFCLTPKINKISQHEIIKSKRNYDYFKDREVWAELLLDNLENYYNFMQKFSVNPKEIITHLNSPSDFLGISSNNEETYKKLRDFLIKFKSKGLENTIMLSALYEFQLFIHKNLVIDADYCLTNPKFTDTLFESIKSNITLFQRGYKSYVPYYDETNFIYDLVNDFVKSKEVSGVKHYLHADCIKNTDISKHMISLPANLENKYDFYEYNPANMDNTVMYQLNKFRLFEFEFLTLNVFLHALNIKDEVDASDLKFILKYETLEEFSKYLYKK